MTEQDYQQLLERLSRLEQRVADLEQETGDSSAPQAPVPLMASGQIGTSLFWQLDQEGHLTIGLLSPLGGEQTEPVFWSRPPWMSFQKQIRSLTLEQGLTVIGTHWFARLTELAEVDLPEGLHIIEEGAFYGCRSLQRLPLPTGLELIGDSAFGGCTALKRLDLPEGLREIGGFAFERCSNLKRVILPPSLCRIGAYAFQDTGLERITYMGAEPELGTGCFSGVEAEVEHHCQST